MQSNLASSPRGVLKHSPSRNHFLHRGDFAPKKMKNSLSLHFLISLTPCLISRRTQSSQKKRYQARWGRKVPEPSDSFYPQNSGLLFFFFFFFFGHTCGICTAAAQSYAPSPPMPELSHICDLCCSLWQQDP